MSKEVNNDKININRELVRKQIFDLSIIFVVLCVIFYFVKFLAYYSYDLLIVIIVSFLIVFALTEYSKNAVKAPLNKVVNEAFDKTLDEISQMQISNN